MGTKPKQLWRTTIVIWSDFNPDEAQMEIEDLARDATSGDSHCESQVTELVTDPTQFPDTEFFDSEDSCG